MIFFIATQMFQWMFNMQIAGDGLNLIRIFGFLEILAEIFVLALLVAVYVWEFLDSRANRS